MGFASHDPKTPETRALHDKIVRKLNRDFSYTNIAAHYGPHAPSMSTVGCVVRDRHGMIVAGTSTGGRAVCYQGRVGDSGQPGNGTYADRHAGISCTGVGEMIMRIAMARIVALYVELGDSLDSACQKAMTKLAAIGGRGGVIAISHKGEIVHKHNTRTMDFAMAMRGSEE
jgi:isoaspartyl peptidase/L-asparaginase-like protein (Ntn-hydrolase superfamily)